MKLKYNSNLRFVKTHAVEALIATTLFLVQSCGLTESKFERKEKVEVAPELEEEPGSVDATKDECGTDGASCFNLVIAQDVKNNCLVSGCHIVGEIGGVKFDSSKIDSFREALLAFTGEDPDKIFNKINKGPHGGGVHTQPSANDLNKWLVAEGVAERVVTDDPEGDNGGDGGGDGQSDDSGDDSDPGDEVVLGPNECGTMSGQDCFIKLIQRDIDDNCMGCHDNVNIGGVALDENNKSTYRQALLGFSNNNRDRLVNKLNGTTNHGGGVQNAPSAIKIREWLRTEGIQ